MDSHQPSMISSDKNLMPSMVVKQQKSAQPQQRHQMAGAAEQTPSASLDEILLKTREAAVAAGDHAKGVPRPTFDQDGLVVPRRVPHHHQQADGQHPKGMRDLNRELKFNQVHGLRVLDQKSELKRAMEKLESSRRRKEAEQERLTRRSSLELRLEERAQRLAAREGGATAGASGTASHPGDKPPDSGILS